jgi:hypothetical protein
MHARTLAELRVGTSLSSLIERCYASAYRAFEDGKLADAQWLFGILALLAPRDARGFIGLALTRERQNDLHAAAGIYRVGLALGAERAPCWLGLARILRRLNRYADADRAFDQAEAATDDPQVLAAIERERNAP